MSGDTRAPTHKVIVAGDSFLRSPFLTIFTDDLTTDALLGKDVEDKIHKLVMIVRPGELFMLRTVIEPDILLIFTVCGETIGKFFVNSRSAIERRQVIAGYDDEALRVKGPQFLQIVGKRPGAVIKLINRQIGLGIFIDSDDLDFGWKTLKIGIMRQMTIGPQHIVEKRFAICNDLFDIGEVLHIEIAIEDVIFPVFMF